MLTGLSIRNVVLIDRLDLPFSSGLTVLTGETGAGKSILLDALGLALGMRSDSGLVRHGTEQATVAATFEPAPDHPARRMLAEQGLDGEDVLVLRRLVGADGRSRAFVNDQPVSVALLRQIGDALIEIQGQHDQRGLLDPGTHRNLLDAYGRFPHLLDAVQNAHTRWRAAAAARRDGDAEANRAERDEAFLRHTLEELDQLDAQPGEAEDLARTRTMLAHAEKLVGAMNGAFAELREEGGAESRLHAAQRQLGQAAELAGGRLDAALAALDRAAVELDDALHELQSAAEDVDLSGGRLEEVEERLFALRDVARKHTVEPDALPSLREDVAHRLSLIEDRTAALARLEAAEAAARADYMAAAEAVSAARRAAAQRLDTAVAAELPPLRLDKARFATHVERLDESGWSADGIDKVQFLVSTNPGTPAGPLNRIASGGELARFMLALKVALTDVGDIPTLVFDEVDAGIGGATADAVGERLARLAAERQILVVTHSPQVAARGAVHMHVDKQARGEAVLTTVSRLDDAARREEVARMLSGQTITDEARAAADRLIQGRPG
ncbi:MAG: DNA repair protein RecN [Alphaproteobacteria bacterium]